MIKNIIFDFGDIFIDLDKEATAKYMKPYGFEFLTPAIITHIQAYEVGEISTVNFLNTMRSYFPTATETQLEVAWNAIIKSFPETRLNFIETLAKENNYKLFLLSNTNALHIQAVKKNMGMERYNRFKSCFDKFYLSHEIGMRKPDKAVYKFVMDQNNLISEECLFIDDLKENTASAETLGLHTWNLQVGKEDITELKRYLNHV